jgi:hypothetical protein
MPAPPNPPKNVSMRSPRSPKSRERAARAGGAAGVAVAVVVRPRLRVLQDLVGGGELLELLLVAAGVRVELAGASPVGALDLVLGRVLATPMISYRSRTASS